MEIKFIFFFFFNRKLPLKSNNFNIEILIAALDSIAVVCEPNQVTQTVVTTVTQIPPFSWSAAVKLIQFQFVLSSDVLLLFRRL